MGHVKQTIEDRLFARSRSTTDGCIEYYLGYTMPSGYGQIGWNGKLWLTHRAAWTLRYGPIPDDAMVLHTCDNPPCINVRHLFLGNNQANVDDMVRKGRHSNGNEKKLSCSSGHKFTQENTYIRPNGNRACRMCAQSRAASRRLRSTLD